MIFMALKEVYFHEYCKKCKYKDLPATTEPCDDCNEIPYNEDSHKPVYFVQEDEE